MATFKGAAAAREALGQRADLFVREARAVPTEEVAQLREIITLYLGQVRRIHESSQFIDLALVERIGATLLTMLDHYGALDAEGQAAVVGALRYFIIEEDEEGDLDSIVGFDDDAEVVNYVIRAYDLPVAPIALGE